MSVVDAIRDRQCSPRFGGWPRASWREPTTATTPVFDAGDVDYLANEIAAAKCPDAVDVMLTDAAAADLAADAAEDVDQAHAEANYYRDYARTVRLACRIAAWSMEADRPKPRRVASAPLDAIEVKARVDIVSYIDKHVRLVKAGSGRFIGICPFHDDHKPSMSVWTDGRWKCFSCGAGGDVITFAQLYHKCEFREALTILAGGQ